jgi:hypothetical protein
MGDHPLTRPRARVSDETQDRIRTLLLRGDNLLKSGRPERLPRALEAFEQAAALAEDPAVEERVRELVHRRVETARAIAGAD